MEKNFSCANCGTLNCRTLDKEFPESCLTTNSPAEVGEAIELYQKEGLVSAVAKASAQVEGLFYKQMTRVEETMEFARRIGAKKIGIATCVGLANEARTFKRILDAKGFEGFMVVCKIGGKDKSTIGIKDEEKINKGKVHESLCNPVAQAMVLNKEKTDLNVLIGLCVGHDSLFCKYSEALCTTLVAKDRVLGHNPVAAIYTSHSYNKQLLEKID